MALKLQGVDDSLIMKIGRWTGLTFLTYIHSQIGALNTEDWRNAWPPESTSSMWQLNPLSSHLSDWRYSILLRPRLECHTCGWHSEVPLMLQQHLNTENRSLGYRGSWLNTKPAPLIISDISGPNHLPFCGESRVQPRRQNDPRSKTTSRHDTATVWGIARKWVFIDLTLVIIFIGHYRL
jgi:hypothetical protein